MASFMTELLLRSLWFPLRRRRLQRDLNEQFIARSEERARIARELHDSVFQGLQGLILQLQAVRQLLPARPQDALVTLDAALERADQAILEGRKAVRNLRAASPARLGLVATLVAFGEEFAASCCEPRPRYQVLIAGEIRALEPAVLDELCRVACEAIRNAFRHACARAIDAELTFGKDHFSIRIEDNGIGIDPEVLNRGRRDDHWGLPGMRERAASFGGDLKIRSVPGAGTEVKLRVPGKIAYCRSQPTGLSAADAYP
jgi:signal transduction histidine kinase